jgi:dUTP pyrophosphatase
LPDEFEAQVRPRSGLAIKQGMTCLNSPGTIDSDYRGEIKVVLINLSGEKQIINPGDRVAQLVLQKTEKIDWEQVTVLTETVRNNGGFGSTGKN